MLLVLKGEILLITTSGKMVVQGLNKKLKRICLIGLTSISESALIDFKLLYSYYYHSYL